MGRVIFVLWSIVTILFNIFILALLLLVRPVIMWYYFLAGVLACVYAMGHGLLYVYGVLSNEKN